MRRRGFIALIAAATARPLTTWAQVRGPTRLVGIIGPVSRAAPQYIPFFDELGRLGLVEGEHFTIDGRGWGARSEQFPKLAIELVEAKVDLFLCVGDPAIRAAQRATSILPILAITDDMLGSGFVRSLSRPEGNTTGVSILSAELDGKRQEIVMELVPGARHIAALADPNQTPPHKREALQSAARVLGVDLSIHLAGTPEEIVPAIEAAQAAGAGALNVLATPLFTANRRVVFARTAALRLPAVYQFPEIAEDGGLVGYGPGIIRIYRQIVARQFPALLRGARPADVPVEQPTKFELVINLKAARAMGFVFPPRLFARADEVIE